VSAKTQAESGARRQSGTERRRLVAEAALTVLAERGARGLTHRAVDDATGLPQGSTSNVFRSRAALLEGALERHAELDLAAAGPAPEDSGELPPISREQATGLIAAAVEAVIEQRRLSVARFELLLESTRRSELRGPIEAARRRFAATASRVLVATGCSDPERHTAQLLAVLDGIVIADLHGPVAALDHDGIAELIGRVLEGC
jgi:AcrR family transcriptional regulator